MKRIRGRTCWVRRSWRSWCGALVVPAVSIGSGAKGFPLPTKIGKGEGKLTMIALGGLHRRVGQAVREADRLQGQREVRRLVRRDGDADARRAAAASTTWSRPRATPSLRLIYGGDIQPVERRAGPGLEGLLAGRSSRRPTTPSRACTTGSRSSSGRTSCSTDSSKVKPAPTSWARALRPEVQGQGHRPRQPDPDRRRGALPVEDEAVARDQGSLRAEQDPVRRGGVAAEAAAAARQEVLGRSPPTRRSCSRAATSSSEPRGRSDRGAGEGCRGARRRASIPKEGATAWLDTWMLSAKSKHPNCAYMW